MKLEELRKLKKGTPVVSFTVDTWIEGTFEGLCKVRNLGRFTDLNDAMEALRSKKGRLETKVVILTENGKRKHVSPRTVHLNLIRKVVES